MKKVPNEDTLPSLLDRLRYRNDPGWNSDKEFDMILQRAASAGIGDIQHNATDSHRYPIRLFILTAVAILLVVLANLNYDHIRMNFQQGWKQDIVKTIADDTDDPVFISVKRDQNTLLFSAMALRDSTTTPVTVTVMDGKGNSLHTQKLTTLHKRQDTQHWNVDLPETDNALHSLLVKCESKGYSNTQPLPFLMMKPELYIAGYTRLAPGETQSLSMIIQGSRNFRTVTGIPYCDVRIFIDAKDDTELLYSGQTDSLGILHASYTIADLPTGEYQLRIEADTLAGTLQESKSVVIEHSMTAHITTDKPIYQPNQMIHIRTLALHSSGLRPVANAEIEIEIRSPKGFKVHQEVLQCDPYGVAATDFQLADSIEYGDYKINLLDKNAELIGQATVKVYEYKLPKYTVSVSLDQDHYSKRGTMHCEIDVQYLFGEPVPDTPIAISVWMPGENENDGLMLMMELDRARTNARGFFECDIVLQDMNYMDYYWGDGKDITVVAIVEDQTGREESGSNSAFISMGDILLTVIPASGHIVPGVPNRFFVMTMTPDGQPVSTTLTCRTLRAKVKEEEQDYDWNHSFGGFQSNREIVTDEFGIGEFTITPSSNLLLSRYHCSDILDSMVNDLYEQESKTLTDREQEDFENEFYIASDILWEDYDWDSDNLFLYLPLYFTSQNKTGKQNRFLRVLKSELPDNMISLETDHPVCKPGELLPVTIRTAFLQGHVMLDVIHDSAIVSSQSLTITNHQATLTLQLPDSLLGAIELYAYGFPTNGDRCWDQTILYVPPAIASDLQVQINVADEFKPGDNTTIQIQVLDGQGQTRQSCLGLMMIDEAVYAIQDVTPGTNRALLALSQSLQQIEVSPGRFRSFLDSPQLSSSSSQAQRATAALLAMVEPISPPDWIRNPHAKRLRQVRSNWTFGYYLDSIFSLLDSKQFDVKPHSYYFWSEKDIGQIRKIFNSTYDSDFPMDKNKSKNIPTLNDLALLDHRYSVPAALFRHTSEHMSRAAYELTQFISNTKLKNPFEGKLDRASLLSFFDIFPQKKDSSDSPYLDPWGNPFGLYLADEGHNKFIPAFYHWSFKDPSEQAWYNNDYFRRIAILSAGPDGLFDTKDDIRSSTASSLKRFCQHVLKNTAPALLASVEFINLETVLYPEMTWLDNNSDLISGGSFAFGSADVEYGSDGGSESFSETDSSMPRVRKDFPETLLWMPQVITDTKGHAEIPLTLADNITTWRLAVTANAMDGSTSTTVKQVRVFQDFFVDINLPPVLTVGDEIVVPVTMFNYLETKQDVVLQMQINEGLEVVDGPAQQKHTVLANASSIAYFKLRALRSGHHELVCLAHGSRMSDAMQGWIQINPDGARQQRVATATAQDGQANIQINFPPDRLPDMDRLHLNLYGSSQSQVSKGVEGLLHLPYG